MVTSDCLHDIWSKIVYHIHQHKANQSAPNEEKFALQINFFSNKLQCFHYIKELGDIGGDILGGRQINNSK